jgi:hypothetical protein
MDNKHDIYLWMTNDYRGEQKVGKYGFCIEWDKSLGTPKNGVISTIVFMDDIFPGWEKIEEKEIKPDPGERVVAKDKAFRNIVRVANKELANMGLSDDEIGVLRIHWEKPSYLGTMRGSALHYEGFPLVAEFESMLFGSPE